MPLLVRRARDHAVTNGPPAPVGEVGRLGALGRLATRDPRLFGDYLRAYVAGVIKPILARGNAGTTPTPGASEKRLGPAEAKSWVLAQTDLKGVDAGPGLALVEAGVSKQSTLGGDSAAARIAAGLAGDASLGELAYVIVRAVQPELVVETGVASGVTSAFVLAALADNGSGRLESVDLPPLAMRTAGLVGSLVPESLRDRWSYRSGASRRVLPKVLKSPDLDVFIHDSDHSYDGMRWELERAWSALRPGGWLIADDVHLHQAFADVANLVGGSPIYVDQPGKGGCTGVMVKPGL